MEVPIRSAPWGCIRNAPEARTAHGNRQEVPSGNRMPISSATGQARKATGMHPRQASINLYIIRTYTQDSDATVGPDRSKPSLDQTLLLEGAEMRDSSATDLSII